MTLLLLCLLETLEREQELDFYISRDSPKLFMLELLLNFYPFFFIDLVDFDLCFLNWVMGTYRELLAARVLSLASSLLSFWVNYEFLELFFLSSWSTPMIGKVFSLV